MAGAEKARRELKNGLAKCRKDKDKYLQYMYGPPADEVSSLRLIFCKGVGNNSIICNGCNHWVNKNCSELQ